MNPPADIFISYAPADEGLWRDLEKHLSVLHRSGIIRALGSHKIGAGENWRDVIEAQLDSARLVLLLLSADFFASDHCYDIELEKALALANKRKARVFPIRLRPYDWGSFPIADLSVLPINGTPVVNWTNPEDAWAEITREIRVTLSTNANDEVIAGNRHRTATRNNSGLDGKVTPPEDASDDLGATPSEKATTGAIPGNFSSGEVRQSTVASGSNSARIISASQGMDAEQAPLPIEHLDSSLDVEVGRRAEEVWELLRAVARNVSQKNVLLLLRRAALEKAIASTGILVHLASTTWRARFTWDEQLKIAIESGPASTLAVAHWSPGQPVALVLADLKEALRQAEHFEAASVITAIIFTNLLQTVQAGLEARMDDVPDDLRIKRKRRVTQDINPIIELVNNQWAVTTFGLECLESLYFVSINQLNEPDWFEQISGKIWANGEYVSQALDDARLIHLGNRRSKSKNG